MPRVSVVVPCSSQKEALKPTIDSILNQSFRDYELIICDDGSTDGTGQDVLAWLGPDPDRADSVWRESLNESNGSRSVQMMRDDILIHYLGQVTVRGLSAARNRALNVSCADYVAFARPGDVWHKRKLAVHVEVMETHRDLHALVGPKGGSGRKATRSRRVPVPALIEFEETLTPPGLELSGSILRRSCFGLEPCFDENLPSCEEYDFWLRLGTRHQIGRLVDSYQSSESPNGKMPWSLDRYRVYSLEKAFQSGHLSPLQRHRVAEVLSDRCGKLAQGYRQRENVERSSFYERKRKRFITEVEKLDVSDPIFSGKRGAGKRLSGATT